MENKSAKVRHMARELLRLEDERDGLDVRIRELREGLNEAMELDETVTVDDQVLRKCDRTTWDIRPAEVYAEVGPRKFVSYVKTVDVPKIRKNLGELWMEEHGVAKPSTYVKWVTNGD